MNRQILERTVKWVDGWLMDGQTNKRSSGQIQETLKETLGLIHDVMLIKKIIYVTSSEHPTTPFLQSYRTHGKVDLFLSPPHGK